MTKLRVTQVRSTIGCTRKQRATIQGLGLGGVGSSRELENTPATRGMVKAVLHLISVDEVNNGN
jgi:large subunit ribosomal protein L30